MFASIVTHVQNVWWLLHVIVPAYIIVVEHVRAYNVCIIHSVYVGCYIVTMFYYRRHWKCSVD